MAIDHIHDILLLLDGGLSDKSSFNHTVTNNGGVSVDENGYLIFNGSNSLDVSPATDFYFGNTSTKEFSFEVNVIFTAYPNNSGGYYGINLVSSDNWTGGSRSWLLQVGGTATSLTSLVFYCIDSGGGYHDVSFLYNFSLNTEYVIGVSSSNSSVSLSINNVIVAINNTTWNFTHSMVQSYEFIRIGQSLTSSYNYNLIGKLKVKIARKSTDLTKISSKGFIYKISINLFENIIANNFNVNLISIITGESLNYYTGITSASDISLYSIINHPILLVVYPYEGTVWESGKAYNLNDVVFPTTPTTIPYYYTRTTIGTSGSIEPTWSTIINAYMTDDGVSNAWQCTSGFIPPQVKGPFLLTN